MTGEEFDRAAESGEPVRLRDRSRCNYTNEWYGPRVEPDGSRVIDTHTGEVHAVDESLLADLRAKDAGETNANLQRALAGLDPRLRIVVRNEDGGYDDIAIATIGERLVAVESRSEQDAGGRHGPSIEAVTPHDPTETVIAIELA